MIIALCRESNLIRAIEASIGSSKISIENFLRKPQHINNREGYQISPKITWHERRLQISKACRNTYYSSELKSDLNFAIRERRIQQIVSEFPRAMYHKMVSVPCFSGKKEKRVCWTSQHVSRRNYFWFHTIPPYENRLNLDGSDGNKYY